MAVGAALFSRSSRSPAPALAELETLEFWERGSYIQPISRTCLTRTPEGTRSEEELVKFDCSNNELMALDVSRCYQLKQLNCSVNQLVELEDDEEYQNPVDLLFEDLAKKKPNSFAGRQYKLYKLAAGKTAKSILISCGARLAPFDIQELRDLTMYELAVLDGGKCILQLRGVRPFLSDKYDLTQHPNYKLTSDFDEKNRFDIEKYLNRKEKIHPGDEFIVVDADSLPSA